MTGREAIAGTNLLWTSPELPPPGSRLQPDLIHTIDQLLEYIEENIVSGFINPMTTQGDMIVGGAAGVAERFPLGAEGALMYAGATAPEWLAPPATRSFMTFDDGSGLPIWNPLITYQTPDLHGWCITAERDATPGNIWGFCWGQGAPGNYLRAYAAPQLIVVDYVTGGTGGHRCGLATYGNLGVYSLNVQSGLFVQGTSDDFAWYTRNKNLEETDVLWLHMGSNDQEGQYEMQLEYVFAGPMAGYPANADKRTFNVGGDALVMTDLEVRGAVVLMPNLPGAAGAAGTLYVAGGFVKVA